MSSRRPGGAERVCIEYPSVGDTYYREAYGVYSYGREKRSFLAQFQSLEAARVAYPEAEEHLIGPSEVLAQP